MGIFALLKKADFRDHPGMQQAWLQGFQSSIPRKLHPQWRNLIYQRKSLIRRCSSLCPQSERPFKRRSLSWKLWDGCQTRAKCAVAVGHPDVSQELSVACSVCTDAENLLFWGTPLESQVRLVDGNALASQKRQRS